MAKTLIYLLGIHASFTSPMQSYIFNSLKLLANVRLPIQRQPFILPMLSLDYATGFQPI